MKEKELGAMRIKLIFLSILFSALSVLLAGCDDNMYILFNDAPVGEVGDFEVSPVRFSNARYYHSSVIHNNRLYVVGGSTVGNAFLDSVQMVSINGNGSLSASGFQDAGSLPEARSNHDSIIYNGYLYVIAGISAGYRSNVLYTKINPDGTMGAWQNSADLGSTLQSGVIDHSAAVFNGYLYVTGGSSSRQAVQVAEIDPVDGSLSPFFNTTSLPQGRYKHTCVISDGYLYVIGGLDSSDSPTSNVQYAKIDPETGELGEFTVVEDVFTPNRNAHTSLARNGFLYIIGGSGNGNEKLKDLLFSLIDPTTGNIEEFVLNGNTLNVKRYGHSSVEHNGFLYVVGGHDESSYLDSVEIAQFKSEYDTYQW